VSKATKTLWLGFFALLLIFTIAICALPFLIGPNNYKADIAALIKEKTGRDATFEGDIKLSLFPRVAINTGKITLSNKSGFQDRPFITVTKSDINIKLLPLLAKKIEVNNIALDGLTVNLVKDKQGANNWDDLIVPNSPSPNATTVNRDTPNIRPQSALAALSVGGITVQNARVNWDNQQTDGHLEFKNIHFTADKFVFGEPLKIDLAMDVSGKGLKFPGTAQLATDLRVDEKLANFIFNDSHLDWIAIAKPATGQPLTAKITAPNAALNLTEQTLQLPGLELQSGDVKLTADITGEHVVEKPAIEGSVSVSEFNPRGTFERWDIALPNMSDPKAMTSLGMGFQFHATSGQVDLTNLDVALDDSHGKGILTIKDFAQPTVLFNLTIDALDLDRYLKPQDKATITSPGVALAASSVSMPLEWLRKLDAEGKLAVGKMTFNKMMLQDMHLTLSSKNGIVKVGQRANQFYQGNYSGNLNIDTRTGKPTLSLQEKLVEIHLEPLLKAVKGEAKLGGILTASTLLHGQGTNTKELQASIAGNMSFFLRDGFIKGFNLEKMLASSKNLLKGGSLAIDAQHDQTHFSEIKGTAAINKGLLQNHDLTAKTAKLRSTGLGNANLDTGQLYYTIATKLLKAATATTPEQLHDTPIVIHVGGTFSKPTFALDVAALMTDKNKAKIERFLDKNQDKIDKLMNKLDKKLGPGASELLKKIF
jgi:AsmA protein